MLTNQCGFPTLELNDMVSPASLRELAKAADARFLQQEAEIELLEVPEIAIVSLSAPQAITAGAWTVEFDTERYVSRSGARAIFGIDFFNEWRSGVYHVGTSIDANTVGAVSGLRADLKLQDLRGARLLNTYTESFRHAESATTRGAISLNLSRMVEVHAGDGARLSVEIGLVGAGSASIQTLSTLWCHRVRGLSDV